MSAYLIANVKVNDDSDLAQSIPYLPAGKSPCVPE